MSIPSTIEEFTLRTLQVPADPQLAELIIYINGALFASVSSKRAALMAFVSRPEDEGFAIEIAEKGPAAFTDVSRPGETPEVLREWQRVALRGLEGSRRNYFFDGDALTNAKKIEVAVRLDGKTYLSMAAREPGYMGVILEPGKAILDVVGPKRVEYRDRMGPGMETQDVYSWQAKAVGLT